MKIIKFFMLVMLLSIAPIMVMGQSASDLYSAGISQMAKKEYDAAIRSFNASMAINKSAENQKNCKAKIKECQRLKRRKVARDEERDEDRTSETRKSEPTLTVSTQEIEVDCGGQTEEGNVPIVRVSTAPVEKQWSVTPMNGGWFTIEISSDSTQFSIMAKTNTSDDQRESIIMVKSGNLEKNITLKQKKKVTLLIGLPNNGAFKKVIGALYPVFGDKVKNFKEVLEMRVKAKGEVKVLKVLSSSAEKYDDGKNWRIVSKPDWCVQRTEKPEGNRFEKAEDDELVIDVLPLDKSQGSFRRGEIVIESEGVKKTLKINQK